MDGFEPTKPRQQIYSLPRLTFCAASPRDGDQYVVRDVLELFELVCAVRFERTTPCAQDTCATTALRTEVVGGVWVRACMMGVEYTQKNGAGSGSRTQLNAVWKTGVPPWAYPQMPSFRLSAGQDVCSHGSLHTHGLKALFESA